MKRIQCEIHNKEIEMAKAMQHKYAANPKY